MDRSPTVGPAPGRGRGLVLGVTTSVAGKGLGLVAPLVITPVTFGYLGAERYGLWMTVTALAGMAWFADLGLGDGLLTRLSHHVRGRDEAAREIASAYALLGGVAVLFLAGVGAASQAVEWAALFGIRNPTLAGEVSTVILICFGVFAANIPLSLIHRIQYAEGRVAQSNAWQAGAALLSIGVVLVAVATGAGPLTVILCAVAAVPATNLVNTLVYFTVVDPGLRPRWGRVDLRRSRSLFRLSFQFFLLSAIWSVALNVDNPLAAQAVGLAQAGGYIVAAKLFAVLGAFVTVIGMATWPAVGAALARGDVAWVRATTRRMVLLLAVVFSVTGLLLVTTGKMLLAAWVGAPEVTALPLAVLGWLAVWPLLTAVVSPLFMVQCGAGRLGAQFWGWGLFLILSVPLKLVAVTHLGLSGIPAAGCLAYLLTMWPAAVIGYRRALASARDDSSDDTRPAPVPVPA
ncbi:lipopolysaccharide biosynthesis protein [Micromonospora radicis]|uniref:lipopolysaccharide biosynthesis protein n=1 Tax=Micromonospora radicis TaxID=1894971 RepID=UPI0013140E61|nr:oligosaccharide flippase family protein [Micromonospora radicis]